MLWYIVGCCFYNFPHPVVSTPIPHSIQLLQGWHRLEKYLNLEGFLKSSWKLKSPWRVLENHSKALKSPRVLLVDRNLNQYKIVVPLFSAAYAAFGAAYAQQFYTNFPILLSPLSQSSISEVEFQHLDQYFSLPISPWKLLERLLKSLKNLWILLKLACMNPVLSIVLVVCNVLVS